MGQLLEVGSATFDAAGSATVRIGVQIHGLEWEIKKFVVSTTSDLSTQVRIYRDTVSDSSRIDGSYSGNQDVSDTSVSLQAPVTILFVWDGGTPGAQATGRIEGTQTVRKFR